MRNTFSIHRETGACFLFRPTLSPVANCRCTCKTAEATPTKMHKNHHSLSAFLCRYFRAVSRHTQFCSLFRPLTPLTSPLLCMFLRHRPLFHSSFFNYFPRLWPSRKCNAEFVVCRLSLTLCTFLMPSLVHKPHFRLKCGYSEKCINAIAHTHSISKLPHSHI